MPGDPEAFLALLKSRIHEARITGQLTRYHKLFSAIPRDMLMKFRKIYMNIPAHNPYDVLKEALLRRMAISEEKRIQLLLSGIQLGNLKPFQLLRQMCALVGSTTLDDSVLHQIWLQRLPPYVQSILNVSTNSYSLDELAEAADGAMEQTKLFQPIMIHCCSSSKSTVFHADLQTLQQLAFIGDAGLVCLLRLASSSYFDDVVVVSLRNTACSSGSPMTISSSSLSTGRLTKTDFRFSIESLVEATGGL
ncbi:unnamed protein product [Echinostoma caproni]|uniref:DUF7041 domain-containing protein n=1 Tax=Echinostoma caproni TaxID=27848 RepID=A0A183B5A1_9TREM|nr:unnamed protein product [Echinostoma caproni]